MTDEQGPQESASIEDAASLYAKFVAEREAGGSSDLAELRQRYPDQEAELERLHQAYERVDSALQGLGFAGPLSRRIQQRFGADADPAISLEVEGRGDPEFTSDVVRRLSSRSVAYGRYRVKGEFARGGMGAILRVWDEDLRRHLAMKVMLAEVEQESTGASPKQGSRSLGRFLEEAQVTGQLDHPGIVPVHELGLDPEGHLYFTMKLVKGRTFKEVLGLVAKGEDGWTLTRALGVLLKVCEAMSYAHAKDVIHRDLKPSNIMVGRFGEVYVMDWGLAKVVGRKEAKDIRVREQVEPSAPQDESVDIDSETPLHTMDGDVVGTPAYMSPEQAAGRIDELGPLSDVYSAGAILYHLLAGQMPYAKTGTHANNYLIWTWVKGGPPEPLVSLAPDAPPELVSICERAMAREALERHEGIQEMAEELRAYLEGRVVRSHRTGLSIELQKWVKRNRLAAGAMAAAALILLVGAVAVYTVQRSKLNAVEAAALSEATALEQKKDNLVLQADYAIENAQLQEAEILMAEYRGLDPEDFLPHLVLAQGYLQYLRTAEAEEEYALALDKGFELDEQEPTDARGWYLRGLSLIIERDPEKLDEAVRSLEEAIRRDSLMRAAYFPLYSLHKEQGERVEAEQALNAFQNILAKGDDYYDVVEAILAELQERYQDGIDVALALERRVDPVRVQELRLNRLLGRLYLLLCLEGAGRGGELAEAERRLELAVAAKPTDAASLANLSTIQLRRFWLDEQAPDASDRLRSAIQYGRRSVAEYPRFAPGQRALLGGLASLASQEFTTPDTALSLFEEARDVAAVLRELDPDHPGTDLMEAKIDLHLGIAAKMRDDWDEAQELFESSLRANPNQVLPRCLLAGRALDRGEDEAAIQQLRTARQLLADFPDAVSIQALPNELVNLVHVWTLVAAARLGTPDAIEEGRRARADLDQLEAFEGQLEIEDGGLVSYVEILATSDVKALRDCAEARRIFREYELLERFMGSDLEPRLLAIEEALRDCD